jgi:hypothetical protein
VEAYSEILAIRNTAIRKHQMSNRLSLLERSEGGSSITNSCNMGEVEARASTGEPGDSDVYADNIAAACAAANALTKPQADLTDREQKRRRLQMNRNNAQRNRDRKRIMIDMLQTEKTQLATLNEKLQNENEVFLKHIDELKKNLENKSKQKKAHTPESVATSSSLDPSRPSTLEGFNIPVQPSSKHDSLLYREGIVDALARDMLLQEQLLVSRLDQTTSLGGTSINAALLKAQERFRENGAGDPGCFLPIKGIKSSGLSILDRSPAFSMPNISLDFRYTQGRHLGFPTQPPFGTVPPTAPRREPGLPVRSSGAPAALLSAIIPRETSSTSPDFSLFTPVSTALPQANPLDKVKRPISPSGIISSSQVSVEQDRVGQV